VIEHQRIGRSTDYNNNNNSDGFWTKQGVYPIITKRIY